MTTGLAGERRRAPDNPVAPFIPGDGVGPEVWAAARPVLDAAVAVCYGGQRALAWLELPAGQAAVERGLERLPDSTLESIRQHGVALKGPTATPTAGGHRSINVALRLALDLYANVRPVRYFAGVPSPLTDPAAVDLVIFRENTEDVYAGIEYPAGSAGAARMAQLIHELGHELPADAGIGVKIISRERTRRFIRAALNYALEHRRRRVTIVHKGNIMKATEGAFRTWGYELVREEYAGRAAVAADLAAGDAGGDVVLVDERIADAAFQDLILKPGRFDVIAAPNLNGDYLSDAAAALVGGLGLAPGANFGDGIAVFEPAHGTAPDLAGRGLANPSAMILSGALLLEYLGWREAAERVVAALAGVLRGGRMTSDLAAGQPGKQILATGEFGKAVAGAVRAPVG